MTRRVIVRYQRELAVIAGDSIVRVVVGIRVGGDFF
jgi:hypothetical protein